MEQISNHNNVYDKLNYFHRSGKIPHIILYGYHGTGKKTILNWFINKIYNDEKTTIKKNVMSVNCAHGKGIKFIREELKFFAKTNIQSNNGSTFKSIIRNQSSDSLYNFQKKLPLICHPQDSNDL